MAAINTNLSSQIERTSGAGTANAITAVSTAVGQVRKLLMVTTKYSAAPTQAGVTVVWNNGAGAAYDITLNTGTANAQNNVYVPAIDIYLLADDVVDVSAPAGGGVITSAVTIYTQVI